MVREWAAERGGAWEKGSAFRSGPVLVLAWEEMLAAVWAVAWENEWGVEKGVESAEVWDVVMGVEWVSLWGCESGSVSAAPKDRVSVHKWGYALAVQLDEEWEAAWAMELVPAKAQVSALRWGALLGEAMEVG